MDKTVSEILSMILVCMVDKSVYMKTEIDSPAEQFVPLEDIVNVIEEFKKEFKGE